MKWKNTKTQIMALAIAAIGFNQAGFAQQKTEDIIKNRQATFNVIAGHVGKIKANLDGDYNRNQVLQSAAVIQAIANANIEPLFAPGTDKGTGFHETQLKSEALSPDNTKKLSDAAANFKEQANQLAVIVDIGDKAAVQTQFGKLRGTCKSCHDNFRNDSTAK